MGRHMYTIFFICALVHLHFCDEIKVKIFHKGGEHGQQLVDKLHELGILSLEHPRKDLNFVEAYIPEEHRGLLNISGIPHEQVAHESKEYHEQLKRSSGGDLGDYHTYAELTQFVEDAARKYNNTVRRFSLGKSVQGRDIWALRITNNPDLDEKEPEFKFVGNMHGDETVGRECLVRLVTLLLDNYDRATPVGARVTRLINNTDIWLIPTMNPDGFELGRRSNANFIDLNRNFPDLRFPGRNQGGLQPETDALMKFIQSNHFVLSANLHGGSVVANYPYDGNYYRRSGVIEATPDHALFQYISLAYSNAHRSMHTSREFRNGITNGAEWYVLYGGMQDFNYEQTGCMEITLELSDEKYPPDTQLTTFWNDNMEAMLSFMELIHIGVTGVVLEAGTLKPVAATINVVEINHPVYSDPKTGDYYRLLLPGTYTLRVTSPGYAAQQKTITIPRNQKIYETIHQNFDLVRA